MANSALTRARTVLTRCDQLATCSEEQDRLTRRYGTPALAAARELVAGWMAGAGLTVRRDAVGNLIGRRGGSAPGAQTLLLGSHLDSVRDAGKYDGPLGVLVALDVAAQVRRQGEQLPFAVEVIAFADEEGLRFHQAYLGSRAVAGTLDAATLALTDDDGISLADAIRAFGGDPAALATARRLSDELLGYVEAHIEQGPALETLGLPVGVVTGIVGQSRFLVGFTGVAGHAGTVAMALRRDALGAAAEFILAVEEVARAEPGTVATVGQITAEPGASNVIPGAVRLSLDLRHPDDATRTRLARLLRELADVIGADRHVGVTWQLMQEHAAVPCDPGLTDALALAVAETGQFVHRLPSGAGHDAVILSTITPVAMLFVRCGGGVSHHPAESVTAEDVAVSIRVLERFVVQLAAQRGKDHSSDEMDDGSDTV